MANPEHLKILKQGVTAWNVWRMENQEILPNLGGAILSGAVLTEVNFHQVDLSGADLVEADLWAANLFGANLFAADLSRAALGGANLKMSNLHQAHIDGSDLTAANLTTADLTNADVQNSDFTRARLHGTVFGDNDLSAVKGLETIEHLGPSTIGIDTIYKSKGNIPEVFLRGCGVPEDFIIYMKSLVGKAIDFYSCFISYSSQDDAFAQRLHADLQQKGVRCWFAPEDLKIGDKFRMRIDESIRTYDKVMVILSENSIRSPWVEDEVEAALEKERQKPGLGIRDAGHGQGAAALEKERTPGNKREKKAARSP